MDKIRQAKEKAENYLWLEIEQRWNNLIKDEKNIDVDGPVAFWPFRLEAYSYLGNRYPNKIESFAREVRDLWDRWIELSKTNIIIFKDILWLDPWGFDINDGHIAVSMFRAKKILKIGGYREYFTQGKRRCSQLFSLPVTFSWLFNLETYWNILRSPILARELSDLFKSQAALMIEDELFEKLIFNPPKDSPHPCGRYPRESMAAMATYFLCFSNFGEEFAKVANRAASKLCDNQSHDGSFNSDILATCLAASAIHRSGVDQSKSISKRALDYIIQKQNNDGYWDFLYLHEEQGFKANWDILSTVIALETIDFITDDEPLPRWANVTDSPSRPQKQSRVQDIDPIKTPKGATWTDVRIVFTHEETVQIYVRDDNLGGRDFLRMGFCDHRKPEKQRVPDIAWKTLFNFARHQGELAVKYDIDQKSMARLKNNIHTIRKRLQALFCIEEDPFQKYDRKFKSWKTKFSIIDSIQE